MADPYIKLEHITKSFDSVYANKDISVDVYKGEILALLGDCLLYTSPSPRDDP